MKVPGFSCNSFVLLTLKRLRAETLNIHVQQQSGSAAAQKRRQKKKWRRQHLTTGESAYQFEAHAAADNHPVRLRRKKPALQLINTDFVPGSVHRD